MSIPVVTKYSGTTMVKDGDCVELFLDVLSDQELTYRWYKDGSLIDGQFGNILLLTVHVGDAGLYECVVENRDGGASECIRLIVMTGPEILTQSGNMVVGHGSRSMLFVVASGTGPLGYQWYKDGVIIPGAIKDTYDLYVDETTDVVFTCVVTNEVGSITSNPIVVSDPDNPYVYGLFDIPTDLDREEP